jgi:hypothetical protein
MGAAVRQDGGVTRADDAYLRVATAIGEVRILLGGEDPAIVENCDGFIHSPSGEVRSFTAMTLMEIDRVMQKWEASGESLSGAHLRVPDLVVLRSGGVDSVVAAVVDLAAELPVIVLDSDE